MNEIEKATGEIVMYQPDETSVANTSPNGRVVST